MSFPSLSALLREVHQLGAPQVLCKPLSENDNSKQQIYLGGSFEVLNELPFSEVVRADHVARPNLKAKVDLHWMDGLGHIAPAPNTKLILYPQYPEVRLSGFLSGCPLAPSAYLQPVQRGSRRHNNGPDGRLLVLAPLPGRRVLAYLAAPGSQVAIDFESARNANNAELRGVFWILPTSALDPKETLLRMIAEIREGDWHDSCRLDATGTIIPYVARNGGGTTLEALFGIRPNSRSAPDFMGWELKAYKTSRITLMTPEPDAGFYAAHGVGAFLRKYGRAIEGDTLYFTGTHAVGVPCASTSMTLTLRGFDSALGKITDVGGGIELVDRRGDIAAAWSFESLIEHWGRKHASAAYIPYELKRLPPMYRYLSPVLLGEQTDFTLFLCAMSLAQVIYDPGSKLAAASTTKAKQKARNQFRVPVRHLSTLYKKFEAVAV